ncbi:MULTISPECIES: hypothetical protein [Niastella]|uniref:DUF4375 domain-containing protein n=1 Tax=Niastella soli TaxID=2821487 RepID=A0ABS3Z0Y4_9BACT|nr:hypothetical protein [Niastella soli]MBO9203051.1 hypothetical protein [Niastella soli]
MKWTITDKGSNQTIERNLDIRFDPPDEIAYAFFIGTNVYYFPALLNDAVVERLFGTGMLGVMYYHELSFDDFASGEIFNEDQVGLSHQTWGFTVMNKQLFFEILYEYADKHLTAYRYNMHLQNGYSQWLTRELKSLRDSGYSLFNPNWALATQEGLARLKAKMDDKTGT